MAPAVTSHGRRSFLKAGAALAAVAPLPGRAEERPHLWQGHDFGPGPKPAERLDQGPFDIDQDEGWFTIEATTPARGPVRNPGLGLVGYTWEENGPALAVREGRQKLEDAILDERQSGRTRGRHERESRSH